MNVFRSADRMGGPWKSSFLLQHRNRKRRGGDADRDRCSHLTTDCTNISSTVCGRILGMNTTNSLSITELFQACRHFFLSIGLLSPQGVGRWLAMTMCLSVRLSQNFVQRWKILQQSGQMPQTLNWKLKMADDRHIENCDINITLFQWNMIRFW